jgi:hypothetical protein
MKSSVILFTQGFFMSILYFIFMRSVYSYVFNTLVCTYMIKDFKIGMVKCPLIVAVILVFYIDGLSNRALGGKGMFVHLHISTLCILVGD